jgi:hypothetical protein
MIGRSPAASAPEKEAEILLSEGRIRKKREESRERKKKLAVIKEAEAG